jgi:putative salt-induced outer membrane protein
MKAAGAIQLLLLAPAAHVSATPADAATAPLPDALTSLIREAHSKERRAIVDVAKRLYPDSIARIDAIVQQADKDERASNAGAGLAEGWKGEATIGGFYSAGNTEEWGVSASLVAKRAGPRWTHEAALRLDLKNEGGERTEERAYARYTLRRKLGAGRLFAFGRLSFERDRFSGIDTRFFESVGLGYQLLDRQNLHWDVMAGPALRQTDYSNAESESEPAIFARTQFEWEIPDRLKFSEEADSGLAKGNSTLASVTSLTSNLYGRLSGRISLGVEYESDPPPGRKNTDTNARASLVLDF